MRPAAPAARQPRRGGAAARRSATRCADPRTLQRDRHRPRGADRRRLHRPGREPHGRPDAGRRADRRRRGAPRRLDPRPRGRGPGPATRRPGRARGRTSWPTCAGRGSSDDRAALPTLGEIDRDEALLEAVAELHGDTRADFLRKAAHRQRRACSPCSARRPRPRRRTGSATPTSSSSGCASSGCRRPSTPRPTRRARWSGCRRTSSAGRRRSARTSARTCGSSSRSSASKAGPRPFFNFHGATESDAAFTRTTVAMEDLTVALLTGVTPQMHDRRLTAALFGLLTVEARHAAWARNLVGTTPAARGVRRPAVGSRDVPVDRRRHALHRRGARACGGAAAARGSRGDARPRPPSGPSRRRRPR